VSFSTYTTLQAAIANWLARTDLTATIPDFITLAETDIKRILRRTTLNTTIIVQSEFTPLPADCAELRSVRLSTGLPEWDTSLTIGTVEQLADARARWANTSSRPLYGAVYNNTLEVTPGPDQAYTGIITYYQALIPLATAPGGVNPTLTEYPDLYLYGALLHASPYLEDDARIPAWQAKYDKAVDKMNIVVDREEFGAGVKQARLPVAF
jgi:hypothetical protein